MNIQPNTSTRDLTRTVADSRDFGTVGSDYCCGSLRSASDACLKSGISIEALINSLDHESVAQALPGEFNFSRATLNELVDHIVTKHHLFTRNELHRLHDSINEVCIAHSEKHPELTQLLQLFEALRDDLEPHMLKEERALFPFIVGMEDAVMNCRVVGRPTVVTINNSIRTMMMEQEGAEEILKQIRTVTSNFALRSDASASFRALYHALQDLETDLHQHIQLETRILFPRAIEMERRLLAHPRDDQRET